MIYFSYGSNMSIKRLQARAPSARFITVATLSRHKLKFHKAGKDGSAKCDAAESDHADSAIIGVVFDISQAEKSKLDRIEGLGYGYDEKVVLLTSPESEVLEATAYYATNIDSSLRPYHWYKEHVVRGAKENCFPEHYIQAIARMDSVTDPEPGRHETEMAIYC
ncbi:MAG: gamma-glutamylcyclotransferase [Gammaproteobacteria bacterium]|nr:gamma-glutamylcyclotransferase [Gammaproteobacteria bacterium]